MTNLTKPINKGIVSLLRSKARCEELTKEQRIALADKWQSQIDKKEDTDDPPTTEDKK